MFDERGAFPLHIFVLPHPHVCLCLRECTFVCVNAGECVATEAHDGRTARANLSLIAGGHVEVAWTFVAAGATATVLPPVLRLDAATCVFSPAGLITNTDPSAPAAAAAAAATTALAASASLRLRLPIAPFRALPPVPCDGGSSAVAKRQRGTDTFSTTVAMLAQETSTWISRAAASPVTLASSSSSATSAALSSSNYPMEARVVAPAATVTWSLESDGYTCWWLDINHYSPCIS